jgi:hypothetical protein
MQNKGIEFSVNLVPFAVTTTEPWGTLSAFKEI